MGYSDLKHADIAINLPIELERGREIDIYVIEEELRRYKTKYDLSTERVDAVDSSVKSFNKKYNNSTTYEEKVLILKELSNKIFTEFNIPVKEYLQYKLYLRVLH